MRCDDAMALLAVHVCMYVMYVCTFMTLCDLKYMDICMYVLYICITYDIVGVLLVN